MVCCIVCSLPKVKSLFITIYLTSFTLIFHSISNFTLVITKLLFMFMSFYSPPKEERICRIKPLLSPFLVV